MTDIELSPTDLAEFEIALAGDLAIDSYTQDLLFKQARTPPPSPTPPSTTPPCGPSMT